MQKISPHCKAQCTYVHTPLHHRPLTITDPSGKFHMLLAPDVLYCLSIHAVHPYRSRMKYYSHFVLLNTCGCTAAGRPVGDWNTVIHGSGPKGLTDRHLFLAERVYEVDGGPFLEQQQQQAVSIMMANGLSSRGSKDGIAERRLGHWQARQQRTPRGQQMLLGDASEGLCSTVFLP
jgi:hypothetical protein